MIDVVVATASEGARWHAEFVRAMPESRVHLWPDAPDSADFAAVWRPPAELFERLRVGRAIANLGAGVDALLAVPSLPRDVPIVRLEDAGMAEQMAEYVALAVLEAYRESRQYARQQRHRRWKQRERLDKRTFVVGLLGLGLLGQAVARPLAALGFPVAGWSRSPKRFDGMESYAGEDGLDAMLARTRVAVCLLPLTPATRGLVDRRRLARMPRGSHLVNVARGPIVVDEDLLALLDDGHIATATLDVFASEPLPASHRFWHHPSVTVTPHVSAATLFDVSAAQVAAKFRAILRGETVGGVVDVARGY